MWNLLQRIIGKSSASQEKWMKGLDKQTSIDKYQLQKAEDILRPLMIPAYQLKMVNLNITNSKYANKNGKLLTYFSTVMHPQYHLHLFLNKSKLKQHDSNVYIEIEIKDNTQIEFLKFDSLPMWESLIHIDVSKHQNLVNIAPNQPWTLFKEAKSVLISTESKNQIKGYPQWLVNDVDYRKIKNSTFLFQMELPNTELVVYAFKDSDENQAQIFIQYL